MDALTKIKNIFKNDEPEEIPEPFVAELVSDEPIEVQGFLNPGSQTWIFVRSYLQSKIGELRKENDTLGLGEIKTAHIRAKIELCKELIDLGEPKEENEPEEPEDESMGGFGRRLPL